MQQTPDLVCLSHLRWGFVFQRPNHLMTRFARERRVFFFEEPIFDDGPTRLVVQEVEQQLWVCTPHIRLENDGPSAEDVSRRLFRRLLEDNRVTRPILWFYTPMAIPLTEGVEASAIVYDCMDELSAFHGAHPELTRREKLLFRLSDLVFTGGQSLYEAKRTQHASVHAFPSSVDASHFAEARTSREEPADQSGIAAPRVGFYGVIDERMDLQLLARVAEDRPNVQFVMVGPIVKIEEATLPRKPNIHYLGPKTYQELPSYLAGWAAAMMPFALNDATRFISPTKTLEYLAAGKPVVSTAIRDVVKPYGESGVVRVADAASFAQELDAALATDAALHLVASDAVVAATSWDKTWEGMRKLVADKIDSRHDRVAPEAEGKVSCSTI